MLCHSLMLIIAEKASFSNYLNNRTNNRPAQAINTKNCIRIADTGSFNTLLIAVPGRQFL